MRINFRKILAILAIILLKIRGTSILKEKNWLKDLTHYIKSNPQFYQVMLLIDKSYKQDYRSETIVFEISKDIPTILINFEKSEADEASEKPNAFLEPSVNDPSSTLFILLPILQNSPIDDEHIKNSINFIENLSGARIRPKCLIILDGKENRSYERVLRKMWSKRFLDFTIFDLTDPMTVHSLNPFKDTYTMERYSRRTVWFPNKLQNLEGYEMKVGWFQQPPYLLIHRDQSGKVTKSFGPDKLNMMLLKKTLNFKTIEIYSNSSTWDVLNCNKSNNVGFYHDVMFNKIQMIGVGSAVTGSCIEKFHESSRGIRLLHFGVLIPTLSDESPIISVEWQAWNGVAFISLIFFTWMTTRLLGFDSRNWESINLLLITLGMTPLRQPQKTAERIIFVTLLFACLVYSSVFYSAITSIHLQRKSTFELKTLDDIVASNVQPVIHEHFHFHLYNNSEGSFRRFLDKARIENYSEEECVKILLEQKNIACLMRLARAKMFMKDERKKGGRGLKILDELVQWTPSGIIMEAGSPYVRRLQEVMLKIVESGITKKWRKAYLYFNEYFENDYLHQMMMNSSLIRRQLSFVLAFGYLCSLGAFVGETLVHLYCKSFVINTEIA